ncbi:WbqC family protein [Stutzerimonas tarimensis]|uniref:WbqC family protein n=1 Tax=Stutzerimonas tarimensis TaxID=1507735 RepID=A0ABV7T2H7_9GAMM
MPKVVSLMQPYLFPYLGYFQLIAASDAFVLGDDLQYAKGSWINRNRLLVDGRPSLFTLSLRKGRFGETIGERWLSDDYPRQAATLMKTLEQAYARAPWRDSVLELIGAILASPERNLACFNEQALRAICAHLGIATPFHRSSEFGLPQGIDKTERLIRVTQALAGDCYLNTIGGLALYRPSDFEACGLKLRFLGMDPLEYPQRQVPFVPSLSIIDVLMSNSPAAVRELLQRFTLIEGSLRHSDQCAPPCL